MLAGIIVGWSSVPELALGAVLIVAACVCWGLDNCVTAGLDELAPEHVTLAKGLIAGTTNVVIAFAVGGALPAVAVVVAVIGLGAVGYRASITLWVTGARDIGAARGQLIFSTAPFVGVVVAWVVHGDTATINQLIATTVAASGVVLVLGSGHQHAHRHEVIEHVHAHEHDDHHRHDHPERGEDAGRHTHGHAHQPLVHSHPHVPDLHHRHHHDT